MLLRSTPAHSAKLVAQRHTRAASRCEQPEARGRRNPEAYAVYVEGFRRPRTKGCDAYRRGARKWCRRGDLNPHGLPQTPLKRARLPVPPLRRKREYAVEQPTLSMLVDSGCCWSPVLLTRVLVDWGRWASLGAGTGSSCEPDEARGRSQPEAYVVSPVRAPGLPGPASRGGGGGGGGPPPGG